MTADDFRECEVSNVRTWCIALKAVNGNVLRIAFPLTLTENACGAARAVRGVCIHSTG